MGLGRHLGGLTANQEIAGSSVGEVRSRTDWDPVWTRPNPAVLVLVQDFPKNPGPLGLWSGHSHIARDCLRPGLDWDHSTYISTVLYYISNILIIRYFTK